MNKELLYRIDIDENLKNKLLPYCRLKSGEIWNDKVSGHRLGCLDAANEEHIINLMNNNKAELAVQDPPYNIILGNNGSNNLGKVSLEEYMEFSRRWVSNTIKILKENAHLYVWLGADQNGGFQPLADFR